MIVSDLVNDTSAKLLDPDEILFLVKTYVRKTRTAKIGRACLAVARSKIIWRTRVLVNVTLKCERRCPIPVIKKSVTLFYLLLAPYLAIISYRRVVKIPLSLFLSISLSSSQLLSLPLSFALYST